MGKSLKYAFLNFGWDWDRYSAQGPAHKELADWWKLNAKNMPNNRTPDYNDWVDWYMTKYYEEWDEVHKGPEETLDIMKSEAGTWLPISFQQVLPTSLKLDDVKRKIFHPFQSYTSTEKTKKNKPFWHRKKVRIKPGVNVENVTPAVKNFIIELGNVAEELGHPPPLVTSGWRSVESQSRIMGKNWKSNGGLRGGREYLESLYGKRYGGDMADIFEQYGHKSDIAISLGTEVIKRQPVGSHHIADPGKALDISLTKGIKEVLDAIKRRGRFDIRILDETKTPGPHYHVGIKGENYRVASIENRKNKFRKIIKY